MTCDPDDVRLSRREMLQHSSIGFGSVALATLLAEDFPAHAAAAGDVANPLVAKRPHFAARARSVIFLFMSGGPSHVDTFDYKPLLNRDHDKPMPIAKGTSDERTGNCLGSLWPFRKYGESGIEVSDLFPQIGKCVDDLCIINSMKTESGGHGPEKFRLHTGTDRMVRPTLGSWVLYGLGSENENLPGFVTICPQFDFGHRKILEAAFLPAAYEMAPIGRSKSTSDMPPFREAAFRNTRNPELPSHLQRRQLDYVLQRNRRQLENTGADAELEGRIAAFETAFRMQAAAPQLTDFSDETQETLQMYGIDEEGPTENYARQCLLARRLVERGVRFVEVFHAPKSTDGGWDQHNNIAEYHPRHAWEVDKPIAGLIQDLKQRGLLDETLLVWGGEFGRSPGAQIKQGSGGRDHHPWGFTFWLAGGGVKGGIKYGKTDDYGYHASQNPVNFHDLHATILHLLGLDHRRLVFQHGSETVRLTNALNGLDGNVVHDIIA